MIMENKDEWLALAFLLRHMGFPVCTAIAPATQGILRMAHKYITEQYYTRRHILRKHTEPDYNEMETWSRNRKTGKGT